MSLGDVIKAAEDLDRNLNAQISAHLRKIDVLIAKNYELSNKNETLENDLQNMTKILREMKAKILQLESVSIDPSGRVARLEEKQRTLLARIGELEAANDKLLARATSGSSSSSAPRQPTNLVVQTLPRGKGTVLPLVLADRGASVEAAAQRKRQFEQVAGEQDMGRPMVLPYSSNYKIPVDVFIFSGSILFESLKVHMGHIPSYAKLDMRVWDARGMPSQSAANSALVVVFSNSAKPIAAIPQELLQKIMRDHSNTRILVLQPPPHGLLDMEYHSTLITLVEVEGEKRLKNADDYYKIVLSDLAKKLISK